MLIIKYLPTLAVASLFALLVCVAGCRTPQTVVTPPPVPAASAKQEAGHVPRHGGCLNAVVTCENGHAETKVEGDTLRCWFVGGGTETDKAVRIGDTSITLTVTPAGGGAPLALTLQPKPLKLAEESVGQCSYFEGRAPWLAGMTAFIAKGTLKQYKGQAMPLRIEYPKGYDPD